MNLLCHLSGIASFTSEVVKKAKSVNPNVEILATRKTIPGMREIEKEAVVHGGGMTHRIRLDDAILIKDNHLNLCKDIGLAIKNSRNAHPNLMIEVEADNFEQALEATKSGADRVMLDNFTPTQITSVMKKLENLKLLKNVKLEASGRINEKNISKYGKTGVDMISVGEITNSVNGVDLSLEI